MYNIFERIALEKAIGVALSFYNSFFPFDFRVRYYLGEERDRGEEYYYKGFYWLLGQKIVLSSILPLIQMGILPDWLNLGFTKEEVIFPASWNADNTISSTSKPEIGQGLEGSGKLITELFSLSGWMFEDIYVDPDFLAEDLWDCVEECEREDFLPWFSDVVQCFIDDDKDFYLWKFHNECSMPSSEVGCIFENLVRYCHCYYAYLPDGSISVYVCVQAVEEYDGTIYDECDLSSISILAPLTALYYGGRLHPEYMIEQGTFLNEGGS